MRSHARQKPVQSAATFVPLYLAFASLILIQTRSFSEATESLVDLSNIHKVIAVAMLLLVASFSLASRGVPRRWPAALIFFACYIGIGFVSTANSQYLVYSYWKLAELTAMLLLGLDMLRLSNKDPEFAAQAYQLWLRYLRFLVVAALVGAAIIPSEALRSPVTDSSIDAFGKPLLPVQLFGVLVQVNPNSLGAIAAILLYVELTRMLEGQRERGTVARLLWVVISGGVLVLAQSRTAWMGLMLALVVGILRSAKVRRGTKTVLMVVLACAVAASGRLIVAYMTRGASAEHLSKLSGRTAWWEAAITAVNDADLFGRLFGLGFMSANRAFLMDVVGTEASTLHSDFMDALMSTGYVGVACFVAALLSFVTALFLLLRKPVVPYAAEFAGIGCILMVRSFTGTTFAIHNHFIVGFVIISVQSYSMAKQRVSGVRGSRVAPPLRATDLVVPG